MFNDRDLAREFSGPNVQRGRSYQAQGRVRDLVFHDDGALITARVAGAAVELGTIMHVLGALGIKLTASHAVTN